MEHHQLPHLTQQLRRLRTLPQTPEVLDQINDTLTQIAQLGIDPEIILTNLENEALLQSRTGADADLLALLAAEQNLLIEKLNLDKAKQADNQRAIIELLVERTRRQSLRAKFQEKLDQQQNLRSALSSATEGKPEANSNLTSLQDATALIDRKQTSTGISLSPKQQQLAINLLASDLVTLSAFPSILAASPGPDGDSISQPLSVLNTAIITELAFARVADDSYRSPIGDLASQIAQVVRPATLTDYQTTITSPDNNLTYDHTGHVVVDRQKLTQLLNQPSLAATADLSLALQNNPLITDLASSAYRDAAHEDPLLTDTIPRHQLNNHHQIITIASNQTLSRQLNETLGLDSDKAEQIILSELRRQPVNSPDRLQELGFSVHPSSYASAAAVIAARHPQQGILDPETARLLGRGIPTDKIIEAAQAALNRRGAKLTLDERRLLSRLTHRVRAITAKPLAADLLNSARPRFFGRHLPKYAERFNAYLNGTRNKFLSVFFNKYAKHLGAIADPLGFARSKLGAYAGQRLANYLAGKISAPILKQGFAIMANQGFNQGLNFLSKEAAKKLGVSLLSSTAARTLARLLIAVPGLGLLANLALTLAAGVFEKFKNSLQQLSLSLYGSKLDLKETVGGGISFLAGTAITGAALLAIGVQSALAATFAAAGAAFTTIFLAAAATIIIYFSAFNIAPVISTIAQLDSGLGPAGTGSADDYTSGVVSIPNREALRECGITFPSGYNSHPRIRQVYQPWPAGDQERVEHFIALLYGSEAFRSVMCRPFQFWYGPSHPDYFGWAPGNNHVILYRGAFATDAILFGLVAHELGHYYHGAAKAAFELTGFVFWGTTTTITPECPGYQPYSTRCHNNVYPITRLLTSSNTCYEENFAEYLRFYVTNNPDSCNGAGHRYQLSPERYNWIRDNVFGGTIF